MGTVLYTSLRGVHGPGALEDVAVKVSCGRAGEVMCLRARGGGDQRAMVRHGMEKTVECSIV